MAAKAQKDATEVALSEDQMRQVLLKSLSSADDPKSLIPELYRNIVGKDVGTLDNQQAARKAFFAMSFENDHTLVETVDDQYAGMVIEMRRQIIKDFDCHTHAEKVLVDTIVSGYMRTLRCARSFNSALGQELSTTKNGYLATLSKEMDRANRQMMAAYQALMNLKRPPVQVQVKAKNAFLAQNQQINSNQGHV